MQQKFQTPNYFKESFKKDIEEISSTIKISIKVQINNAKVEKILAVFIIKRPDLGYHYCMNYIVAFLFSIYHLEADVFVMFCHIIENIYPSVIKI